MIQVYYKVEYRLGNAWQPMAPMYKFFAEATKELNRLVEDAKNSTENEIKAFRVTEFTNRISMKEVKVVEL
jgi:hypothetical protein